MKKALQSGQTCYIGCAAGMVGGPRIYKCADKNTVTDKDLTLESQAPFCAPPPKVPCASNPFSNPKFADTAAKSCGSLGYGQDCTRECAGDFVTKPGGTITCVDCRRLLYQD